MWSEIQPLPQFLAAKRAPQHDQQREQQRMGERMDDSWDDMPTVRIPHARWSPPSDAASRHERLEVKPPLTRLFRRTITKAFSVWLKFPDRTGTVARLASTCRTLRRLRHRTLLLTDLPYRIRPGSNGRPGCLICGIRGMLMVPSPHTKVRIAIDDVPIETVQVGCVEVYDDRQQS